MRVSVHLFFCFLSFSPLIIKAYFMLQSVECAGNRQSVLSLSPSLFRSLFSSFFLPVHATSPCSTFNRRSPRKPRKERRVGFVFSRSTRPIPTETGNRVRWTPFQGRSDVGDFSWDLDEAIVPRELCNFLLYAFVCELVDACQSHATLLR